MEHLLVKSKGRFIRLCLDEVDWIEAQKDYVRIHARGRKLLMRGKIGEFERRFGSGLLMRIHRSTMVNPCRVRELEPLHFGEYAVWLDDGTRLAMSRSRRARVLARLAQPA